MKKLILLGLATVLFAACQEKAAIRYTQQSLEIETVKSLIKNYNNKIYEASVYADTSKTYFNTKDNPMPSSEALDYHKANAPIIPVGDFYQKTKNMRWWSRMTGKLG